MLAGAAAATECRQCAKAADCFSHKVHAGTVKLPCKACHPNPDPGDEMTIHGIDLHEVPFGDQGR